MYWQSNYVSFSAPLSNNGSFDITQSCRLLNRSLIQSSCMFKESWVLLSERILFQVQAAETGFMRRVHGVTFGDKVRCCGIRKTLNAEPLFRIERS